MHGHPYSQGNASLHTSASVFPRIRHHRRALKGRPEPDILRWVQPIRRNLPLLMSALLAAVVGTFGWLAYDRVEAAVEQAAGDRLTDAAERLGSMLATSASQVSQEIRAIAADPVVIRALRAGGRSEDPALLAALGRGTVGGTARVMSRALWSRDCTQVASTGAHGARSRCPATDSTHVPGSLVGPFEARGDSVDYWISAPVRAARGDTLGYVTGMRTLAGGGASAIEQLIGPGTAVTVGNASGSLWTDLQRRVPGPSEAPLPGGPYHAVDARGVRQIGAAVPVPRTSWVALVEVPHRTVLAPARQLVATMAAAGFTVLLLGALGAWAISRRVTRPIEEIAAAAAGIASGDYTQRVPVHRADELGHLAAMFNSMAAQVEVSTNDLHAQALELEQQVQEAHDARRDTAVVRSLLDDVLASAPVGIAVFDTHLRYLKVNAAMAAMNGYPAGAHLGHTPAQVDPAIGDAVEPLLADARNSGRTIANQRLTIAASGAPARHWLATVFPVRDIDGDVSSVGVVVLDTTAHQQLEAQFLQAQKMEAVGRLAGGVAHDFNNLLTVILSYASMALETLTDADELRGDMEEIRDAASRAAALTRQLLAFSRNQVLQPQVIDLNDVARGMERMLRRLIGEDIELVLDLAPHLHEVRADPGQMEQVIMNLAVNARDSMPDGGRLVIATANGSVTGEHSALLGTAEGECVLLTVSDSGQGMTEETQARLCEPFFTTKPAGKGTGLGLSTVYGIVQQSGGDISVESSPGAGATFRIRFPRTGADSQARRRTTPRSVAMSGTETVLLVEDDASLRALARRVLTEAGYDVLEAHTPEAAVEIGQSYEGDIHLLLTDVVMPGLGGRDVAAALRARRPAMRVLYMSGYTDDEMVRRGVIAESVRLLQKPFTPVDLMRCVREALEPGGADAGIARPGATAARGPAR